MAETEGHDPRGRFAPGNKGGPGGPRRHAAMLRRAAEEAITTEHVEALMRKALRQGLEGNLQASRFVMEQAAGRVPDAPPEIDPIPIKLPPLETAADCAEAAGLVLDAFTKREVTGDDAETLQGAINTRLKAIEVTEVEQRLVELENIADAVEHGRGGRRRL